MPKVRFGCYGPKRASDGYQIETPPALFSSDGVKIIVGLAENGFDSEAKRTIGSAARGSAEELIAKGSRKHSRPTTRKWISILAGDSWFYSAGN
jgi:hypothetical protein